MKITIEVDPISNMAEVRSDERLPTQQVLLVLLSMCAGIVRDAGSPAIVAAHRVPIGNNILKGGS